MVIRAISPILTGLADVRLGGSLRAPFWGVRERSPLGAPQPPVARCDRGPCRGDLVQNLSSEACTLHPLEPYNVKSATAMPLTAHSTPTRHPRPLNRALILDAAVSLIEQQGPGALSMRRLGSRLGVEAMALYHHFDGRDELLTAIGDRLLEPLHELELSDDWREACRRFATALRDVAVAHPSTFQLVGLQPLDTPASLRPVERLLGVIVKRGFKPGEALGIYRATVSYARGYALAEATGFTVDAAKPAGRKRLGALPRDDFPILAGRARELTGLGADAGYELGLRALLAGMPNPGLVERIGREDPPLTKHLR